MVNMAVYELPQATLLDYFIQTEIQAPWHFVESAQRVINDVVRILQGPTFPYSVVEIIKTGSLGQGTALRDNLSDIDLVIYLNQSTVEIITANIERILNDMHIALHGACLPGYKVLSIDEFRLGIQLIAGGQIFEADLLPGIAGIPNEMYNMLYQTRHPLVREHYSVSFAKLQIDFLVRRPIKVKNLFQLVKYWSKVDLKRHTGKKVSSYLMSVIVILTWEQYGRPQIFRTEIGFKAVLKTLVNYQQIQKVWYENYDSHTFQCFGVPQRPYLIDPANPSVNMLVGQDWHTIALVALFTMASPLLRNVQISQNWQ